MMDEEERVWNRYMPLVWQHPYVNLFKHFNIQSWKKASKEGEVSSLMDKTTKCTVYRITGSIPAGNYIQFPKTSTQSLGLTGRYMYLLFKPVPSKYFVVHVDVATTDGLVVRISFSNLFKEFKSTSTWLQFPFVCHAAKGTIYGSTGHGSKDHSGPAPVTTRWTLLCLDFQYILSMYLNRRYAYTKTIKLCANMFVKNIFTSDNDFEPGISMEQAKRSGALREGKAPLPREMAFPLGKNQQWMELYDFIKFPSDGNKKPFDSIQHGASVAKINTSGTRDPRRVEPRVVNVSRKVSNKGAIDNITDPKKPIRREPVSELPFVGVDDTGNRDMSIEQYDSGEVHVYAHPKDEVLVHKEMRNTGVVHTSRLKASTVVREQEKKYQSLSPDPILKLHRICGFGGATTRDALWTSNGTTIVYPCHAVVVAMLATSGHQRFFIGHTDKVSCISLNGNSSLLASGQTGQQSVVRVWKFKSGECLAMFKTHVHSLHCLSYSHSGSVLCGVGKDGHGKNMVVIWNTERVAKAGEVSVMAKAHTDVDISRMRIAAFDDTRMVSCGRDNIRFWRVKDGSLRSAPVNLGEYHMMEFTDCSFSAGYDAIRDPLERTVYACSRSGHIFEIDYKKVAIENVRKLLPYDKKSRREKQTFNSGPGISITSMNVNEAFCATGSDDGYLRLWPLDFQQVYLEAKHEGPVTAVHISSDGLKILAGTSTANLGILDVSTRAYTTVMRSHTGRVLSMALDPVRRHLATVSDDHTIRVWDMDTMQQMYDFSAPKECPTVLAYHPTQQVFGCGFESGSVRVFSVTTTSMLAEHKQHRGKVIGVAYSPNGDFMYSAGSLGSLALYDASDNGYQLLRLLGNTLARGERHGPEAITVSPDGRHVAFVGPTDFTVSVVDARSLDEVMRIDITSLNPGDVRGTTIDTATQVLYAPSKMGHLLVTTSTNKLLKFDARTGKILAEIDNVHRSGCTALHVSGDRRHLATAGDKVLKIWDYHMRLDLNFQVFIGHAEPISRVMFTPDSLACISCGDAIFFWDFLAHAKERPPIEGRTEVKSYFQGEDRSTRHPHMNGSMSEAPREHPPQPTRSDHLTDISQLSAIQKMDQPDLMGAEVASVTSDTDDRGGGWKEPGIHLDVDPSDDNDDEDDGKEEEQVILNSFEKYKDQLNSSKNKPLQVVVNGLSHIEEPPKQTDTTTNNHPKPTVHSHFIKKSKAHGLAQRLYVAPPNQSGLKLKSVIGYNGNARGNMVWHPDTGVFAYTSGNIIVIDDLGKGQQQHLLGHTEEISCLALQNDSQMLASASGSRGLAISQLCIWDLQQMVSKKVLTHHEHDVVSMSFSRDDRFLISVGDYRECSVVVWDMHNFTIVTSSKTSLPMHGVQWDPYTVNEFVTVGQGGSVLFWLLDETGSSPTLNVHEAEVPHDLLQTHHIGSGQDDFTALAYAVDSVLYIASSHGTITAWDTRQNSCFMHWEGDSSEIGILVSKGGRLISGSVSGSLRLWSTVGVGELKLPGQHNVMRQGGLSMEDELNLDGAIIAAAFDDTMDMGIVGTAGGTLWYINWTERASIRLVAGHVTKVNALSLCKEQYLASCADDGSLRIWSLSDREQTVQFQVVDQSCNCLAFSPITPGGGTSGITVSNLDSTPVVAHAGKQGSSLLPHIVAGYSDGTVRMFDLNKVEMILKMHPHAVAVSAISFSVDGRMILSGASDGLVAISSPTTGMTVRVINDHKGVAISCIDVALTQDRDVGISAPQLWLACGVDRRVSVWSADWTKDSCELVDWLTFPAPAFTPDGAVIKQGDTTCFQQVPPSCARFSPEEPDMVIYTGYGMQKLIQFYSLTQKKVVRTMPLTHWAMGIDVCPSKPLIAVGTNERVLKLMDYYEGSFQDFTGHEDSVQLIKFSPEGAMLFTAARGEILVWDVTV